MRAVLLDLVSRDLDHLVAVLGVIEDTSAGANGLVSEMRSDKAELVLRLKRSIEETVHELQGVLLVFDHTAAVNASEVQVEVSGVLAATNQPIDLGRLVRQQLGEIDDLHRVDRDLLPVPLLGLGNLSDGSHDCSLV